MSVAAAPTGVVTFLFSDIEGSTRRWEADADAMRAALAAHDEVLRQAIEAHGGFIFKHTGDGVCAAFASPRSAVDTAVAAQQALELPVRMGIATGEAELRDGDYFGAVLNRAARVMAAGHGRQILLADSTAVMLSGVDLVDLGPRRLRDVPMPVGVFQARAPGLRTDFPALRALDTSPGNLRPATTSVIGRDSDIDEVLAAVRAHRLVTLTGVGGVGKTRLALEVAVQLADEFPDGVWFFELAAVNDSAALPDAVAAVLGITQQPGKDMSESIAAALEGRVRLLVIDNCEHLVDAAADLIEAILAQSATAKILATSREGLGVANEQSWPVPSLDLDAGIDSSAVTLFAERARSVAPHFALTEAGEADAVVEICQRLDGIPLGIELAASRMTSMTASEVRDRLDDRFRLLIGSRRGTGRHHTLRHAVAWSYDLLDDPEKSLLARCSVFSGGFDLQSARAVAGSDEIDEYAVLDLLDALVRKSLLVAERSTGRTRYSMLETIRQFAEEQLVAHGEATEVRTTHARYFAGREVDILALWDSPRQREAYDWLTAELPNLRTAFRWAADNNDIDAATAIACFAAFLGIYVEQYEAVAWSEELVEPARAIDHRRLALIYVMAAQCYVAGRIDDAVRYAEDAELAIASGRFDQVWYEFEATLSGVYMAKGDTEQWVELCRNMIARWPDAHTYALARLVLALVVAGAGDEAMTASEGLLAAADAADNPHVVSVALSAYGRARRDSDPVAAYDVLRRGLRVSHESGNRQSESNLAVYLSMLAATHGDPMDALEYITLAIRNRYDSGSFSLLSQPLAILTILFDQRGRYEPAATISKFALTPFTRKVFPEIDSAISHLREVLGDVVYETFARAGETMTTSAMATYALDQIDQARAGLKAVSK